MIAQFAILITSPRHPLSHSFLFLLSSQTQTHFAANSHPFAHIFYANYSSWLTLRTTAEYSFNYLLFIFIQRCWRACVCVPEWGIFFCEFFLRFIILIKQWMRFPEMLCPNTNWLRFTGRWVNKMVFCLNFTFAVFPRFQWMFSQRIKLLWCEFTCSFGIWSESADFKLS